MNQGKKTHIDKIVERIKEVGYIDNYFCIENKLTYRLGARIFNMKELGWEFRTEKKGKNWYYYPISWPTPSNEKQTKSSPSSLDDGIAAIRRDGVLPVEPLLHLKRLTLDTSSQEPTYIHATRNEMSTHSVENATGSSKDVKKNTLSLW